MTTFSVQTPAKNVYGVYVTVPGKDGPQHVATVKSYDGSSPFDGNMAKKYIVEYPGSAVTHAEDVRGDMLDSKIREIAHNRYPEADIDGFN